MPLAPSARTRPDPTDPAAWVAVAVGGALGAVARYAIAEAVPRQEPLTGTGLTEPAGTVWPWATFTTNLLGCFLVGLVVHGLLVHPAVADHARRSRLARPFLVTGILGGFTTFSAVGVESLDLVDAGRAPLAVAYVGASVVLGVVLVAGSGALARRRAARR